MKKVILDNLSSQAKLFTSKNVEIPEAFFISHFSLCPVTKIQVKHKQGNLGMESALHNESIATE